MILFYIMTLQTIFFSHMTICFQGGVPWSQRGPWGERGDRDSMQLHQLLGRRFWYVQSTLLNCYFHPTLGNDVSQHHAAIGRWHLFLFFPPNELRSEESEQPALFNQLYLLVES